jgi:hypothetical protein
MAYENKNTAMNKATKNYDKLVHDVVKSINWQRIKYFHHVFGIKWEFEEEKEGYITERYPTVAELKEELRTLLGFAIAKNMPVLDYGNWIILWKDEDASKREGIDGARLEAIFSLEDSIAIETHDEEIELLDNIKKKMDEAVTKEDYAKAAKLRDKIDFLEKRKKYD